MRKFARVGATAAGTVGLVLMASAFAAAPSAPAAPARIMPASAAAAPLARIQPGGPIQVSQGQAPLRDAFSSDTVDVSSRNWGGYVAGRPGTKFRSVQATFFVPYLDCASTPDSFSGHWVGLDGFGSATVEQDGILAACQGSTPVYSAWYEMFPLPPVYSSMTIRPGNTIVASVYYHARTHQYTLRLSDTTRSEHFTKTATCPSGVTCQRDSAEAISEAPSDGSGVLPLSDFRAESYSSIAVVDRSGQRGGFRAPWWEAVNITTTNSGGTVLDQPTAIYHGIAFGTYWMAAQ
jgi:Peptidase A4 family